MAVRLIGTPPNVIPNIVSPDAWRKVRAAVRLEVQALYNRGISLDHPTGATELEHHLLQLNAHMAKVESLWDRTYSTRYRTH